MESSKIAAKEELRSKVKKFNTEKVIGNNLIKDNFLVLNGRQSGSTLEIERLIRTQYQSSVEDLMQKVEKKISHLLSDNVIDLIKRTLDAHNEKSVLESEINRLTRQLSILKTENENRYTILELESVIEDKQDQLEEKEKIFKQLYKEAIKNSTISGNLAEMIQYIREIEDEEKEKISQEIELLQAKANALKLLRFELLYDTEIMIEKRMDVPATSISEKIIRSSGEQIPLINVLLK